MTTQGHNTTTDNTTNGTPDHKKRAGRPCGIIHKGSFTKPEFRTEIIDGVNYYHTYNVKKTKEGKTIYYKCIRKYEPVIDRKKRVVPNAKYTPQKIRSINSIKTTLNEKLDNFSLQELETINRIFKEVNIEEVKNSIIRLHGPSLVAPV